MSTPTYRPPVEHPHLDANDPGLLAGVARGEARLTPEQGLELLTREPLYTLGRWADARCRAIHGDRIRTYVIDRNINYTNVCTARCTFCAFRRDVGDHDAYTLPHEVIYEKIAELVAIGGTQILMQGGMNPELPLDWYLDLLRGIKERFPMMHVHAFSPPEMIEFVEFFSPPGTTLEDKIRWVLIRLQDAGMDSLPGGGGEIFAPPVRRKIGLGKCDHQAWLTTMYVAHSLGMFTSASMMFGHIEGYADRVHHMWEVRRWQDRALRDFGVPRALELEPNDAGDDDLSKRYPASLRAHQRAGGHYTAFIAWPFQRENTPMGNLREWGTVAGDFEKYGPRFPGDVVARLDGSGTKDLHPEFGRRLRMSGAVDYLRVQATARLFLDNVYSMGSSWVTMGPHVGQLGLMFGANDMGSVMMEENVVSAAGTTYCLDEAVLCRLVRDAGFIPAQRDNYYDVLSIKQGADAPDLRVTNWAEHRAKKLHVEQGGKAELTVGASGATTNN
ncbi:MAG: radical SAM protein [Phycisphaerales bacterium]|nr:radical SAM protein [Phycisphaerales bacterium]